MSTPQHLLDHCKNLLSINRNVVLRPNMEETYSNNKVIDNSEIPHEFQYNIINRPWGDRSSKSKIGIVSLLIGIFITIMGLVVNGFLMHSSGSSTSSKIFDEFSCHLTKMEKSHYVARIHSVATHELLCVGAVISTVSVVANHVCVKSGPVRLHLGVMSDPRCRKGFSVSLMETIPHEGVIGEKLVLLTTYENIKDCSETISIGMSIDVNSNAYIIGRPYFSRNSLSRRPVLVSANGTCNFKSDLKKSMTKSNSTICVDDYGRCPVRAGDLLVQDGLLFGLASTSLHHTETKRLASFANLGIVAKALQEMYVLL